MDRVAVIDAVLNRLVDQRPGEAVALATSAAQGSSDPFAPALTGFAAFMAGDEVRPTAPAADADPEALLLGAAVSVLAASMDAQYDGQSRIDALPALAAGTDAGAVGAFARYVATEAALAIARLDVAQALCGIDGTQPWTAWSGHDYAPVMLACAARTEIFAGRIDAALALLDGDAPDTVPGLLMQATKALAAGNAADLASMRALVTATQAAGVVPSERLGSGVHLLLAFSVLALGDTLGAVQHLLRAGGGPGLERLTIIDRVLGYEMLVAAAVTEDDLTSAQAWEQCAAEWSELRTAAPAVSRIRARVALLAGDSEVAEQHATRAVHGAGSDGRGIELAESEIVRARARLVSDQVPAATRGLRAAVEVSDRSGHAAVRLAASRELRSARRRLPPPSGSGWDSLSARERGVAELILAGVDNAGIAAELSLSPTTVRTHATRVLTAFGVGTRIALLAATRPRPVTVVASPELTERQAEVAAHVAAGHTNAAVAELLGLSVKSVERHVTDILLRWDVRTRFDLAHRWWAEQSG